MTGHNYQVRRATVDDLVLLRRLWQQEDWPLAALEKRLTEFQVVETAEGTVLGAIGLQIEQQQGKVHSEAYSSREFAGQLRARLWDRLLSVARSHGLHRLWIRNCAALFWVEQGFKVASIEAVKRLPASMAEPGDGAWLILQLRPEPNPELSVDVEWALFRQSQEEEARRRAQQARLLQFLAAVLIVGVFGLMCYGAWLVLHHVR